MAKTYTWEVNEEKQNEENTDTVENVLHTIKLVCSPTFGKAIITIDGDEYNISTKPFKLKGTEQMFRLGELPAVVAFPKKGEPTVTVGGEVVKRK